MGLTISKLECWFKGFDPKRFCGLYEHDLFCAYKTFFEDVLTPFQRQTRELMGGTENILVSRDFDIIFVGPLAIEILLVPKRNKKKQLRKKYVAKLHPVMKSDELRNLVRGQSVRQIFLQVLLPGHTCFLVFRNGIASLLDNHLSNFGFSPDIVSCICDIIPWNNLFKTYKNELQLYTFIYKPPIKNYCALITMACIKQFIIDRDWDVTVRELSIVSVRRDKSNKQLVCTKQDDVDREKYYSNVVMQCFFQLIKQKVITQEHFEQLKYNI